MRPEKPSPNEPTASLACDPGLDEPPTNNVDFFKEERRTNVVTDLRAWHDAVQKHIENPIRRDLYLWLLFTGCRAGESCQIEWSHVDLKKGTVKFPEGNTKTTPFELPLSGYLVKLLRAREACPETIKQFGKDCRWVFPTMLGKSGHVEEWKLNKSEIKLFERTPWAAHTLRHTWNTISQNKVRMPRAHSVLLQNHKERFAINGDAHEGYNHPDLADLRKSQQKMTAYLLSQIAPMRLRMKGPRSFIRTTTDFPFARFVTRTLVPKGIERCAAVVSPVIVFSPLAVRHRHRRMRYRIPKWRLQ